MIPPNIPAIIPILKPNKYPGNVKNKLLHKLMLPPCGILKITIVESKLPNAIKIPVLAIILLFKKFHSKIPLVLT